MLGVRVHTPSKKDNVPILLELLAAGIGGEKINKETNKMITDRDERFGIVKLFLCLYLLLV